MIPPDEFTPSTTTLNLAAFTASTSTKGVKYLINVNIHIRVILRNFA
jgi:hypothetical protein